VKRLFIKLVRLRFVTWAAHTLIGHIVLFGILTLIIGYPVMTITIYSEGDFTLSWMLHAAIYSIIGGGISGILLWFIISRPLIKWKNRVESERASRHQKPGGGR